MAGKRASSKERLEEAVGAYREALKVYARASMPHQWAEAQYNLANALTGLAACESGTARLEEAIFAYREALTVWTEEAAPYWHNIAQQNLTRAVDAKSSELKAAAEH
jgi:tetratricopeptide (TPR) repeat protein